jgi:hypothetical protein
MDRAWGEQSGVGAGFHLFFEGLGVTGALKASCAPAAHIIPVIDHIAHTRGALLFADAVDACHRFMLLELTIIISLADTAMPSGIVEPIVWAAMMFLRACWQ